MNLHKFIRHNRINMNMLGKKMEMPPSTFIHKIHVNRTEHHLKKEEQEKLLCVLNRLGNDILQYVKQTRKIRGRCKARQVT